MSFREYASAVEANIDYYENHPDKYSPGKIEQESWLPREIRNRIIARLEVSTGRRKRQEVTRKEFFAQAARVKAERKRFFAFFRDKQGTPHKRDLKTGRFVKLTKTDRRVNKVKPTRVTKRSKR